MNWVTGNWVAMLFAAIVGGMISVAWFKTVTGKLATKKEAEGIADKKIAVFKVYVDRVDADREKAQLGIILSIEAISNKIDAQSATSLEQQETLIDMMPDKKD